MLGFENEVVRAYLDFMAEIAVILGANRESAHHELKSSLELEMKLVNVNIYHKFF